MFDMDPFGGKKVPCTKYLGTGQRGFPEEPGQGGFHEEPGPGNAHDNSPIAFENSQDPYRQSLIGETVILIW